MAQSLQSIEALIKNSFALQVAVRSTEDADAICRKNRLTFSELLRPFSHLGNEVSLKDIQGHKYTLNNVKARFSEPQLEPIPETKLRLILSNVVQKTSLGREGKLGSSSQIGQVTILATTPWFDYYRDALLENLKQSDHECIRHYIAVLMVVSTSHPDPVEAFSQLYLKQKESEQSKHPKWFTPHLYYHHVLLHDVSEGNAAQAHNSFEKIKGVYGAPSCYLLQVNSRAPGTPEEDIPDPWNQFSTLRHMENDDEVDGPFGIKFKIGRKAKKAQEATSPQKEDPNTPNKPATTSNHDIVAPNVREEAMLINSDSNNSLSELNQTPSVEVEPGNDPLTQVASEGEHREAPYVESGLSSLNILRSRQVGQCLSLQDHINLRHFVQEFVGERLLLHLEAVMRSLHEWLVSRRSVRHSFSSISSRVFKMFGASGGPLNSTYTDEPSFAFNSLELQNRQLADLAFLLQNYDLAFQTYLSVKRTFQSSSAWMHYAGAVEMCALSAYLQSSTRRDVVSYLEEAISLYNVPCKAVLFGTRASLFLSEILKERGYYRELSQLFIRMTAEDADLHSAVFLEQAANAFLRIQPSMPRKYALHLILAGHRYAKAVQREHSTRAYKQALEVYRGRGWTLAEDYIHFSLARHSFALHRLLDAKVAFEHLLSHESAQTPNQQLLNVKDYIYVHRQLLGSYNHSNGDQIPLEQQKTSQTSSERIQNIPTLPLPFVNTALTRVTFTTGICPQSIGQLVQDRESGVGRGGSVNQRDSNVIMESLQKNMKISTLSLAQQWKHIQQSSGDPSQLIIGAKDYNPSRWRVPNGEWNSLEKRAASGPRGVHRENFKPSVLVMDHTTSNSEMPVCVVNEPVAVSIMLKNPMRIPLHMGRVTLTWHFTPRSNENSLSPGASSEVLERVVLEPEEQRMVTLHLTPLKEGELEVLSFLYSLCIDLTQQKGSESPMQPGGPRTNLPSLAISSRDSLYLKHQGQEVQTILAEGVQGRVEIGIQGPRLNNTKAEKASVVYGHDYRLRWIVTSPMPKVLVCLSDVPGLLLAGEVCRVGVDVFNCGQVALNSLRLTSNLSQHTLLEEKPTGGPIYPSNLAPTSVLAPSTLPPSHLSPHSPYPCLELPLPRGRLEPGEGVSARVLLQAADQAGTGEVPWNLVFYYEPALITGSSRISHRVLRQSSTVRVRESLHVRSFVVHGQLPAGRGRGFDINQLVITLEMENNCQILESAAVELRILQVSCASRRWTISKIDRQQGLLCLLPGEGGIVHLKASRSKGGAQGELCFSDVPLGQTVVFSSQFPAADLFFGSSTCRALGVGKGGGEDIALIVFWQALVPSGVDTLFSYGHHSLTVPLPQSMAAVTERALSHAPSPYDLVKYLLDHPTSLHHDFTSSTLCQIPVHITLQNCCHDRLKVVLELFHPKEGTQQESSKRLSHHEPNFLWTGGTCRRHLELEGSSSRTITAYANFCKPGMYNLNCLRVLAVYGEGGSYHVQRWQRTSYVTID